MAELVIYEYFSQVVIFGIWSITAKFCHSSKLHYFTGLKVSLIPCLRKEIGRLTGSFIMK